MINPIEQIDEKDVNDRKIILHIYNITKNNAFIPFGLGLYHSSIEIFGREYSFGSGCGIFYSAPKFIISTQMNGPSPAHSLHESIEMGKFEGTIKDFHDIIEDLSKKFKGKTYNILSRNCNHFSQELLKRLSDGEANAPNYVNRLASTGISNRFIDFLNTLSVCVNSLGFSNLIVIIMLSF